MKIQYGDKFKIIPKKFSGISDIGKCFMTDKLRLIPEERELLTRVLAMGVYNILYREWWKGLNRATKGYINESPFDSIQFIIRRSEPGYYAVTFKNGAEVRCDEMLYRKGKEAGIRTSSKKRSY